MYYVYCRKKGKLLLKTNNKEDLHRFIPKWVDVHYVH